MATSKVTVHPSAPGLAARRAGQRTGARRAVPAAAISAAFEELYRAHAGRLFSLACRMLGNPTDAEDLLQEIFLSAHRKLDSFRGESALGTWLYRLATNQCLDHVRSRAARTSQLTDALDDEPALYRRGQPRPGGADGDRRWTSSARSRSCPKGAAPRSCCTTSKGWSTAKSPRSLGIAEGTSKSQVHKARCGCARCCPSGSGKRRRRKRRQDGQNNAVHAVPRLDSGARRRHARGDPPRRARACTSTSAPTAARSPRTCSAIRDAAGVARAARAARRRVAADRRPAACRKGARRSTPAAAGGVRRATWRWLAIAAALVLAVGASTSSCCRFRAPRGRPTASQPAAGRRRCSPSRASETEFRLAEQHYQNAIAKLEKAARLDQAASGPERASIRRRRRRSQKNLQRHRPGDRREPRRRCRSEPHERAARDSLFDALKRKVSLLQDTIALMNEMRKGNTAGAAQIVDG